MFQMRYDTDRLADLEASKSIAEKVRSFFLKNDSKGPNRIDWVEKRAGDPKLGGTLNTMVYNFHGATVVVREWAITEFNPEPHKIGVVSCKWGCDNELVNKYIIEGLEKIDGLVKNRENYNLPF